MTDRTPNNGMPGDVLLAIFSSLDVCDLVSCRQVCWQFYQVIASDLSLQYRMALAFNGLVEPSTSSMTLGLPGRLEGVRKYEAKLQRVNFSCITTRLLDQAAGHLRWQPIASTSGSIAHIVSKSNGDHMLSVYLPSSLSNGDFWQSWDVPLDLSGIPVRPECVAVDPLQDLLVVAEAVSDIWDLRIRLLSLSSGGRTSHRSATEPILKYCTPSGSVGMILPQAVAAVRIFARYVAVVAVGNDEEPEELLVWDWRAGSLSVTAPALTRSPTLPVALLDESHLAVSRSWTSDVDVYCVGSCSVVEHCAGSCQGHRLYSRKLCTLSVSGPPFDGTKWSVANIFSEFPAKHHTDAACQSSSSFRAQPSSAAVVFQLTTGAPDHFKKTVVLDSSSLHDVFRDAHQSRPLAKGTTRPALPFAEWGSGSLVLDERAKPGPYLHVADVKPYGSKVVLLSYPPSNATERTGHPAHPRVHVLDIDRWVAKRTRALVGDAEGDLLVQCWEKGTELDCFVDPLASGTRLPFAVYKGPTITFPDGHYPVGCIASQSGFSLMFVDLLRNKPAGFQTWTLV